MVIELTGAWTAQIYLLTLVPTSLIIALSLFSLVVQGHCFVYYSSDGTVNSAKLISANNTNLNNTNITSAPGGLLTYTNSTNKIKIEYPSYSWVVDYGYGNNTSSTN